MNTKDQLIADYLAIPCKVGDSVIVRGLGRQDRESWGNTTKIVELLDNERIVVKNNGSDLEVDKADYKKCLFHIGVNPFKDNSYRNKLRVLGYDLDGLLSHIGYDRRAKVLKSELLGSVEVPEVDYNPFVTDLDGNKIYYQRGKEWCIVQERALIDSIYAGLDIGKIVLRKRDWDDVERNVNAGIPTAFKDCVDGKQRLTALVDFISGKFDDSNGYYWNDLSDSAQRRFLGGQNQVIMELSSDTTDKEVIDSFLNVNIGGIAVDESHINFVKSINI